MKITNESSKFERFHAQETWVDIAVGEVVTVPDKMGLELLHRHGPSTCFRANDGGLREATVKPKPPVEVSEETHAAEESEVPQPENSKPEKPKPEKGKPWLR